MKRIGKFFLTVSIIEAMFLMACGNDSGNAVDSDTIAEVKTIYSLGACKGVNEGVTKYVMSENAYYKCSDGVWETEGSSDSKTEEENAGRTEKSEIYSSSSISNKSGETLSSSFAEGESSSSTGDFLDSSTGCEGSEYDADAKTLKDCRDGKVYRTVQIGDQIWMAEDLAPYSEEIKQYSARELCPSGWHLPNNDEWLALINIAGEVWFAGAMLKSTDYGGVDKFGFAARSSSNYLGLEGRLSLPSDSDVAIVEEFECGINDDYNGELFSRYKIRCLKGDYPSPSAKKLLCDINPKDSSEYDAENNILKDLRDGQSYRTVVIGSRVWMAENLNYVDSEHGECNNYANCVKYGALYTAEEYKGFITSEGPCPKGWQVPDTTTWRSLIRDAELEKLGPAGMVLKATSGWLYGYNGLDTYGFSALPQDYGDAFADPYSYASFWGVRGFVEIKSDNYVKYVTYGLSENDSWDDSGYNKRSVRCVIKK